MDILPHSYTDTLYVNPPESVSYSSSSHKVLLMPHFGYAFALSFSLSVVFAHFSTDNPILVPVVRLRSVFMLHRRTCYTRSHPGTMVRYSHHCRN